MRQKLVEKIIKALFFTSTLCVVSISFFLLFYILSNGIRFISLKFIFTNPQNMGLSGGIFSILVGTIVISLLSIIISVPLGIGTALFLVEYSKETTLTRIIRFGIESLAAIPSIIYGLFGFIFFVVYLRLGWSILSGSLTLSLMILPLIIRTSEEAIKSVPYRWRIVSYSLGANKIQTILNVVLPSAAPGILTGVVLSLGRCVAESAAVIFTAGVATKMPTSAFDSIRTMAVHFYILVREGISTSNAFATGCVLLILTLFVNTLSYFIVYRFRK